MWKTLGGQRIEDLAAFTKQLVATGTRRLEIGTDSLQGTRFTQFVTVVAMLTPGKGGRVAFKKEDLPRIDSLRERLLKEVWLSISVGLELNQVLPKDVDLTVHVDATENTKFRSSSHVHELVGMVVGQGFKVAVKPDSWAATHAADHIVRIGA